MRDVDRALLHVTWNENLVAADDRGDIGYWHPGLHPLRPIGYDERLPYPGTGQAEWRGLLPRRRDPFVLDPKRGWVASWNNVPSAGWTSGDGPARERLNGPFHRSHYLYRLVAALARRPSFAGAKRVIRSTGTVAQQRPLASNLLRRAARGARGRAATVLGTLLRWKGSYARTDGRGTVDPGVATWEQFKSEAERIAIGRLGPIPKPVADGETLTGATSNSHMFDATNGESYALRTLPPVDLQRAAIATFGALSTRFKSQDPATWREPRRLYPESAQGAGSPPDLPFFDRGTWEQFVEVGR